MPRRPLNPSEIVEARLVFGEGLDYSRAFVFENARWPNLIADLGGILHRHKRTWNNGVALGNTCYFPVQLRTSAEIIAGGELKDMAWLIHELTHQWQYQRIGWRYLTDALSVQLREGLQSYNYQKEYPSREAALQAARAAGRRLADFNPEQQGELARDYYLAIKQGREVNAWGAFVAEFRS